MIFKKEIEEFLPTYEKERKIHSFLHFCMNIMLTAFCIFIVCAFFAKLNEQPSEKIAGYAIITIFFTGFFVSIISGLLGVKSSNSTIKTDFESTIKNKFMKKLVNIFLSNASWRQNSLFGEENNIDSYIQKLEKTKIFNFIPFIIIDDCITGYYNDVKLTIHEISTKPITYSCYIALIIGGLLTLLEFLFSPIFHIIAIITIIISFPVIIFFVYGMYMLLSKIYQYSPFRGLVIELDFAKDLKQETFFLNRSLASKRVPFNKDIYREVHIESGDFTKNYQIYSNSQIESRLIFTPHFIEKINTINKIYKTSKIRGHFKNNKLILTINTNKNMFALGGDFTPTNYKTFLKFYEEMISIFKLIDEIKIYLK